MKKKHRKGQGRKLFDGKEEFDVIRKLEQVWGIGGSDKEASFYADISPAALSDYLKGHPLISERKQALLNKPILKARQEVVSGLNDNPEFSLKYLERKCKDEFALKQSSIQNINVAQTIGETDEGNEYDRFTDGELLAEDKRQREFFAGRKKKNFGIPVGKDKKK